MTDEHSTSRSATRSREWPITTDDAKRLGVVGAALLAAIVGSGLLITQVLASTAVGEVDRGISRWFEDLRTPTWNGLTDLGSGFSDTITIVIALAVLLPILWLVKRRWNEPLLLAGAVALETAVFVTAGWIVGRERPPVEQLDTSPPTASFPSGHTGAAFAFYLALLVIVYWWTRHRIARIGAAATFAAIPVVVAVSRLYRGMHFLTDVLFGAVVGVVSLAVFATVLRPPDAATTPRGDT